MSIKTSIVPWLTFNDCAKAVAFYKNAFGATETYRLELPEGDLIVRLAVEDAEFWLADGQANKDSEIAGHESIRFILTVYNPELYFQKALNAGATEIYPIGEDHGWRLGRIVDPFGIHWEIGYEIK